MESAAPPPSSGFLLHCLLEGPYLILFSLYHSEFDISQRNKISSMYREGGEGGKGSFGLLAGLCSLFSLATICLNKQDGCHQLFRCCCTPTPFISQPWPVCTAIKQESMIPAIRPSELITYPFLPATNTPLLNNRKHYWSV